MNRNTSRRLTLAVVALASATLFTACPRQGEGPAERVGKTMDKGAAAVGHGIEKTGEAIEGAAEGK